MAQYIPLEPLVAEIESMIKSMEECFNGKFPMSQSVKETEQDKGKLVAYKSILSFIHTLEVKEVDLEKEYRDFVEEDPVYNKLVNGIVGKAIAKHFFELGMQVNNPITAADRGTAEEIIINLKRVEQDYRIDLTKEIGWVRNKAQKGEITMATIKSFTSLEQSKKLAEILPIESADMYWMHGKLDNVNQHPTPNIIGNDHDEPLWDDYDIPCWSLSALLAVLPEINGVSLKIKKVKAEDGYDGYYYPIEYEGIVLIPYSKNPVDACYEMIEHLHKLKLL